MEARGDKPLVDCEILPVACKRLLPSVLRDEGLADLAVTERQVVKPTSVLRLQFDQGFIARDRPLKTIERSTSATVSAWRSRPASSARCSSTQGKLKEARGAFETSLRIQEDLLKGRPERFAPSQGYVRRPHTHRRRVEERVAA